MPFYRFVLSALTGAIALPAFAADTLVDCPVTVKADNLVAGSELKIEIPLLPLGQLVSGGDIYCSETMKGDIIQRRWHERAIIREKPARIDHYDNGIGIAWGPKSAADFPVINSETKTHDFSSLDCRSWKSSSAGKPILDCTAFPAIAEGAVKPIELSVKSMAFGGPEIKVAINPRAFHDGTYLAPNREKPLTLTYADTTKTLYFIGGGQGFTMAIFGGKNELDKSSAKRFVEGLNTGPTATLSYTDYKGGSPNYTFTETDIEHAQITMALMQQLSGPIMRQVAADFDAKQSTP